jgi:hypothetical protein
MGERRFLKKELDMGNGSGRQKGWSTAIKSRSDKGRCLLDLLVNRGGVAVLAELLQLKSFGGVASVLHGRVTGHARRTLGGVGPAFGALKSDDEPDALVFGHGKDVAPR